MRFSPSYAGRIWALLVIFSASSLAVTASAKKPDRRPPPPPSAGCAEGGLTQPKYAMFLDGYPTGRWQLVELPCLDTQPESPATPRELALDLPKNQRRKFQIANGDVFYSGGQYRFVFAGRTGPGDHWGIWGGVLDISGGRITDIHPIVRTAGKREEDPRFSVDGQSIVYKSVYDNVGTIRIVSPLDDWGGSYADIPFAATPGCELWVPTMLTTNTVAYVRRCDGDESDRVVYDSGGRQTELDSLGDGPDRFSHFTPLGDLVYSHLDTSAGRASLWYYNPGNQPRELLDWTESDDDPFADRQFDYIAFSGWGGDGYDLYLTRLSDLLSNSPSAVKVTDGINVLGTVTFGYEETLP
jgi:hypothetical protein